MNQPPQPPPGQPPRMPQPPWYERQSAPLSTDEWDAYDEMMRPGQKPGRRKPKFFI